MNQRPGRGTLERYGHSAEFKPAESLRITGPSSLLVNRHLRGAFDSERNLVEDTMRLWDVGGGLPDSVPATLPELDLIDAIEDEVVWGGSIINAYGHFLIESVSRLWPLLPGGRLEGLPVVWTTPRRAPYIQEWCEAFGVKAIELPHDGVMRFTEMFVPEPAWRLNAWIAPEIREVHLHARAGIETPSVPKAKVLWLSRSGLERARIAYDEVLLEWLLREHVSVVNPEMMSLGEQIAAIEGSESIAGIVGSAFHTLLMANRMPNCVLLCGGSVRGAYADLDALLEQNATFVHGLAAVEAAPSGRARFPVKFPFGSRVLIPETLRALSRTILPALLEDQVLKMLAAPESLSSRVRIPTVKDELMTAIARVLIDPLWMHARMRLGRQFEEEGLHHCALEQYELVAELSDGYAARASHYAARSLARLGRSVEASEMAKRALSIDTESRESAAATYVLDASD